MSELDEIKDMYDGQKNEKLASFKDVLGKKAEKLKCLDGEKEKLKIAINRLNADIGELEDEIKKIWSPFIAGAEEAKLNCNGVEIRMVPNLSIKIDEDSDGFSEVNRDQALKWFETNGFKDLMRWDLNTNTMKKHAKELYESNGEKVPGLRYTHYHLIKVK